jgi:hypothetical protein
MALFTENEVRTRARQSVATDRLIKKAYASRSAGEILREATESFSEAKAYDIFLSHSIKDEELILGIKAILEDLKYTVYVDWIDDPQLDRSKVTASDGKQFARPNELIEVAVVRYYREFGKLKVDAVGMWLL